MNERTTRYRDILPIARLAATEATVIGIGAIGRSVALLLAAMGIGTLRLIDFDSVDAVNLGPQGYNEADVGLLKVDATAEGCRALNSELSIETVPERFRRELPVGDAVFGCVDSIATRKSLWRTLEGHVGFYADARMAAEALRVLTVVDEAAARYYRTTLFAAAEAYPAPCTAKATGYCAAVAAGLLVAQFARHLRGHPVEPDLQLNLLAMEFDVASVTHE